MVQRIITAVIAALLFLPFVILGGWAFRIITVILAVVGLFELFRMKSIPIFSTSGFLSVLVIWVIMLPEVPFGLTKMEIILVYALLLLAYTVLVKNRFTFDEVGFLLLSIVYVGMGFYYLLETRSAGLEFIIYAFAVIWATDSGAYFFGRAFGKTKLWPLISPKKTVEGFIGGIGLAVITALIFQYIYPIHSSVWIVIIVTIFTSICGQIGDLVESALKRHYNVKDSGKLLPGHGGILDRFDSLIYILPILHFVQFIS
ncbi:phosphatidate cytidylyltransferase [Bacillaceae bacterium S4-13-58]